jgi:hypothetical protein
MMPQARRTIARPESRLRSTSHGRQATYVGRPARQTSQRRALAGERRLIRANEGGVGGRSAVYLSTASSATATKRSAR